MGALAEAPKHIRRGPGGYFMRISPRQPSDQELSSFVQETDSEAQQICAGCTLRDGVPLAEGLPVIIVRCGGLDIPMGEETRGTNTVYVAELQTDAFNMRHNPHRISEAVDVAKPGCGLTGEKLTAAHGGPSSRYPNS